MGNNGRQPTGWGRGIKGALINMALVAASLTAAVLVVEVLLFMYEERLLESIGVDTEPAAMDHTGYAVARNAPNRTGLFTWRSDGSSLIHVKSPNETLVYEMRPNTNILDGLFTTNSFGFRDEEFSEAKPEGAYRIIVVGDSITLGWQVRAEQTYPKVLETLLNSQRAQARFEVYNMGLAGYNAEQELEIVKAKGLRFHPDCILVGYCINDNRLGADAGLWRHFTRGKSRTVDFLKLRWLQWKETHSPRNLLERSYEEFARLSKERAMPVVVLVFPHVLQAEKNEGIRALCEGLGLRALDLFDAFHNVGMKDAFLYDGLHLSPLGHKIVAEEVCRYLGSQVL